MRKTGVIAYFTLLLAITGIRAGPLSNSTIGDELWRTNGSSIHAFSNETVDDAVIFTNGTDSPRLPGFNSVVGVVQNGTDYLLSGRDAVNGAGGSTDGTNVSLAANQSSSVAAKRTPRGAVLPSDVSSTNRTTALCNSGTRCFTASVASGSNATRSTERNTTSRNDTTREYMLNDEDWPEINETVDGNSSVCPPLVSREGWGGRAPLAVQKMKTPVPFVVIHHTYIPSACNTSDDCEAKMRSMQEFHMGKGWLNIGYNFIVGGDNRIYIGRGWDVVGAHSPTYNSKSIGISFIGDYRTELPSLEMRQLAWSLIHCGIARGSISETYKLVGHRQVRDTECPGDRLYQEIQTWPHWVNHRDIIPRTNTSTTS